MTLGAAIGAPVGAAIGGAIGTGVGVVYLRPRYQEWCKTEAGREFAGKMSVFLNEDRILEHLICPITQMPVIEGVRTPDGQLYEKSQIERWVKLHGTNPKTRESITVDDLKVDENASLEAAKAFVKFLQDRRKETEECAPELMPGYDKLIQDTREAAMGAHNIKLVTLQKQWKGGRISYEKLSIKSKELAEKYLNI